MTYIVEKIIARGGFGLVEQLRHPSGAVLARKTFAPAIPISNPDELEKLKSRFRREVKVQTSLNSQSFIPIISSDLSENPSYLMPLADRNFHEQIVMDRQAGAIPRKALADILNALEELHQLGFVHRDLKPQNVLLHDDVWKLTDFGLVLPPQGGTTKLTSMDSNWGTAAYCAPEQSVDFRGSTVAVDIYAFGCILHDIFSNQPRIPYQRQTAPGAIGAVIEKCTEQRPDKRFKSIQALRGTLLTLLESTDGPAASPKAAEWAESLLHIETWDLDKAYAFARYVNQSSNKEDRYAVFTSFDEEALTKLFAFDSDLAKHLSLEYCDWVHSTGFSFEYCDVLAKRLELVFDLGDLECKAAAMISTAELARSHNRWYVMGFVLRLCGPSLDDKIAQRIAIEIEAAEAGWNFSLCATGISRTPDAYHPRIAAVLQKPAT